MIGSERYNYAFDPDGEAWAARLIRQVPTGAHVLELGPGPGAMTRVLLDRGHPLTVVENDPDAIVALKAMGAEVLEGDLNAPDWWAPLAGRRFGAILACDVLEHLNAPEATLRALRGLAEPAARLIVSMPNVAYAGLIAALRLGQFEYADKGLLDRTHMRFFTRSSLSKALMVSGWAPDHWEGNHVPPEHSEFVWCWRQLGEAQRQALVSGWADFDVYQWMTLATPMEDAAAAQIRRADAEISSLKEALHALTLRHEDEHASLLEHQKAFAEAKATIGRLGAEMAEMRSQADVLEAQRRAAAADLLERDRQLQAKAAETEHLRAQLDGLRAQGWPGRLRRLMAALRG